MFLVFLVMACAKIRELLFKPLLQGEDGSHLGSKRLQDIECELGEQKKSTAKITKLCLAAIKALESLEKRSPGCDITSMEGSVASLNSTSGPVDPMIIKTICEQLDVINKLLVKVMVNLKIFVKGSCFGLTLSDL